MVKSQSTNVALFDETDDNLKNAFQNSIISSIITYTYGEGRCVEQISKYLGLPIVTTQYYLNRLEKQGLIMGIDQPVVDGLVKKTYQLTYDQAAGEVKVNSEEQLAIEAKRFGSLVENLIVCMREGRICATHATGVMLDNDHAQIVKDKIGELHEFIQNAEKESLNTDNDVQQYNLVSVYGNLEDL